MTRAAGVLVILALIGGAVWIGVSTGDARSPTYSLHERGAGRSIGTLRVGFNGELCWDLSLASFPRAIQLHHDATGPSDPVVLSLYEPPGVKPEGCARLDREYLELLPQDETRFYVDGHNEDDEPHPVIWASIVEQR